MAATSKYDFKRAGIVGVEVQSMAEDNMNSERYWENRFVANDWEKYDGGKQTMYFADIARKAFPDWFTRELNRNNWTVTDWGCAEGEGTALLAKAFPNCAFKGIDFSHTAVEKARNKFPACDFEVGDITKVIPESDVIFSSNTLEHLRDVGTILKNLVLAARNHTVFLLPLHDDLDIAEHFNRFEEDFFPLVIENRKLSYFRIIDCDNNPLWPGEQLLLIYSAEESLPQNRRLSELFSNEEYIGLKKKLLQSRQELQLSNEALTTAKQENINLSNRLTAADKMCADWEEAFDAEKCKLAEIKNELIAKSEELNKLSQQLENAQSFQRETEVIELKRRMDATNQKIDETLQLINSRLGSKQIRLIHFLNRLKFQGFNSDREERRKFRKWFFSRFKHIPDTDRRYHPMFSIIDLLNQAKSALNGESVVSTVTVGTNQIDPYKAYLLEQPYQKIDIIVLAIIDYDFRHQRPQHFAQRLAQKGHRVFYVNANFSNEFKQSKIEDNLWQVTLANTDFASIYLGDWKNNERAMHDQLGALLDKNAIRDATVIVDYPNWVYFAAYMREKYGLRTVTDYMDDFTGFINPAEDLIRKNCIELLGQSDGVMASSQFLFDIASQYSQSVTMNRNGTEYEYFHQAYGMPTEKKRPTIGYYGAIAEWFNIDIICYCAERFQECDIVLVGNVTAHKERLEKYKNIQLVGEVPYTKLLPWLASFDVCLIPFDTSTDLIKATNPVKFYEYLSAGKKIVATEIPELEPYKNQFVYLENQPERFGDAVERCLAGKDDLATVEDCFAFAKDNDWDARVAVFEKEIKAVYPKISVIVLCYNQLDYTIKCVESIFNVTAYPNYELVLVDNASSDQTADYLKTVALNHDNAKIVLNKTNRGFAGGNNDGIAVADGEYIVLLNNDTVVTRGWLTNMLKHFSNDEAVGLVGPVTNSIGNEARINVTYTEQEQMPVFADSYTNAHMGEEYNHHGILAMFCLMISRELYNKVGPLDEHYGIGMFEDDDYSIASEKNGYRNVLAEDVFIHHFGSVSFKKLEDETYRKLFEQNKAYYEQKWGEKWRKPEYRPGVL